MNRIAAGHSFYHVVIRATGRVQIFHADADYKHSEAHLIEGIELTGIRILSFCVMQNKWHRMLYPRRNGDMSESMRWVTTTLVS